MIPREVAHEHIRLRHKIAREMPASDLGRLLDDGRVRITQNRFAATSIDLSPEKLDEVCGWWTGKKEGPRWISTADHRNLPAGDQWCWLAIPIRGGGGYVPPAAGGSVILGRWWPAYSQWGTGTGTENLETVSHWQPAELPDPPEEHA